jgi:hypothetical protein
MTLHLLQIFFTDARTFICCCPSPRIHLRRGYQKNQTLFVAVNNPTAIQVVWTQFDGHAVTWKNADKILAHSSRNMGQNLMVRLELHLEHGIGQCLNHRCHYLNRVFFRQAISRFWCFRTFALD